MFLNESLNVIKVNEILAGIGRDITGTSVFPEYLHILGNWAIFNENKVMIKNITSTNVCPLGSVYMYPAMLWPKEDRLNYYGKFEGQIITIEPNKVGSDENYCYFFEIIMRRNTELSATKSGYKGNGAFTVAYNLQGANTADYDIAPDQKMPKTAQSQEVNLRSEFVFLETVDTLFQKWQLKIYLVTYILPQLIETLVYSTTLKFLPSNITAPQKIDSLSANSDSLLAGGISGLITEATSEGPSGIVKDIQIITPKDEKIATDTFSYTAGTSANNFTSTVLTPRQSFIKFFVNKDVDISKYILPRETRSIT